MPSGDPRGENREWTDTLFRKLLIANRGEIACRIIRTARRFNIQIAAVYSDADRNSLHTKLADESVYIGASRPSESYLNVEKIMDAARSVNADSLHPGYGFLSENSHLSKACERDGVEFIGPPSNAIEFMASKSKAAEIAIRAGVPVLPGYRENQPDDSSLNRHAREIGFPVLLKAALGGGGRGMSIVHSESELTDSLESVRAQAKEFFGDDLIIVEKYLNPARHIEIQVAADKHGNVIHLFDRDCSAQRRYQKIIEEAPAPNISDKLRQRMYEAAVALTKSLDYHNVGTVELLVADDEFYFMEMNTRLQVEHTVTEQVTGVDLVEWQLRIANGESVSQDMISNSPDGHSIQARIYAEDPTRNFLPSPGYVQYCKLPPESKNLQIHTGIRQGDSVDVHYDPMIAKVVVSDSSRSQSIERLQQALCDLHVVGVDTNIEFLSNLLVSSAFKKCEIDIKYVENHLQELNSSSGSLPVEIPVIALLFLAAKLNREEDIDLATSDDVYSPWRDKGGWRLNSRREYSCSFEHGQQHFNIGALIGSDEMTVKIEDQSLICTDLEIIDNTVNVTIEDVAWSVTVLFLEDIFYLFHLGSRYEIKLSEQLYVVQSRSVDSGSLNAPLPGRIARVLVQEGESVSKGQVLIIVEAMKMEHPISSPIEGIVTSIPFLENQLVDEGARCAYIDPIKLKNQN